MLRQASVMALNQPFTDGWFLAVVEKLLKTPPPPFFEMLDANVAAERAEDLVDLVDMEELANSLRIRKFIYKVHIKLSGVNRETRRSNRCNAGVSTRERMLKKQ